MTSLIINILIMVTFLNDLTGTTKMKNDKKGRRNQNNFLSYKKIFSREVWIAC